MLKLKSLIVPALLLSGIMLVFGCILSPSSKGGGAGGPTLRGSSSYTVQGNKLIVTRRDTSYSCDTNMHLQSEIHVYTDTTPFVLEGDSLFLIWADSDTYYEGAVIQYRVDYIREGAGSDLQGRWKYMGESYKILSGTLSASDKALLDGQYSNNYSNYYETDEMLVTASNLYDYSDFQSAKLYIDEWNGTLNGLPADTLDTLYHPESFYFDISLALVDQYTVRMTGNVTHEVVTRTEAPDYFELASSNPQHARIHLDRNMKPDCTDTTIDTTSDWFSLFRNANAKPGLKKLALTKRALIPDGPQKHNLSPLFRSFPRRHP